MSWPLVVLGARGLVIWFLHTQLLHVPFWTLMRTKTCVFILVRGLVCRPGNWQRFGAQPLKPHCGGTGGLFLDVPGLPISENRAAFLMTLWASYFKPFSAVTDANYRIDWVLRWIAGFSGVWQGALKSISSCRPISPVGLSIYSFACRLVGLFQARTWWPLRCVSEELHC